MPMEREDWHKLTKYHRDALRALSGADGVRIDPDCPISMTTALHDLWRFGLADRHFNDVPRGLSYSMTDSGRACAAEILATTT